MSNSCEPEAKSTQATKMAKISGSAKNYEHPEDKAERLCRGGYADGGTVSDGHTIRYGWQRNTQPDGTRIDTPSWGKAKE